MFTPLIRDEVKVSPFLLRTIGNSLVIPLWLNLAFEQEGSCSNAICERRSGNGWLLGKAIKLAGLHGKEVRIVGKSWETL